jgi:hypothetical protein
MQALPFLGPEGRPVLTIIVKGTFAIRPGERARPVPAEEQIPFAFADVPLKEERPDLGAKFESDAVPYKPRADVVLVGHAHAPPGKAAKAMDVALRVGELHRTIRVFGDRSWSCGGRLLPAGHSDPKPFKTMELTYARAFGGIDKVGGGYCRYNLAGRGYLAKKSKGGMDGAPLPNLEDPKHLIKRWDSRPRPVGFGFYGRGWLPRLRYLGTHDERWRKERAPLPPEDFRFEFYNGAHPDLQIKGWLRGDEAVELIHLTPEPRVQFGLPAIMPICSIVRVGAAVPPEPRGPSKRDREVAAAQTTPADEAPVPSEPTPGSAAGERIPLRLDTLILLPDEMRLVQVWRGLFPLADLAPREVATIGVWLS